MSTFLEKKHQLTNDEQTTTITFSIRRFGRLTTNRVDIRYLLFVRSIQIETATSDLCVLFQEKNRIRFFYQIFCKFVQIKSVFSRFSFDDVEQFDMTCKQMSSD